METNMGGVDPVMVSAGLDQSFLILEEQADY
jgi:hypothetical protein